MENRPGRQHPSRMPQAVCSYDIATLYRILCFLQNYGAVLITTETNLRYELFLTGLENRLLSRPKKRKPVWVCEECEDGNS